MSKNLRLVYIAVFDKILASEVVEVKILRSLHELF